jgi:hypothetical protein
MARARKSHESGKEEVKSSRAKLEPAYSSNGRDRFVVYADLQREGDPYARVLILKFQAKYAARRFIDMLIHTDEWEWTDPNRIAEVHQDIHRGAYQHVRR